jgi:cellulose synthase/poly-beta-1,6-N-acetylglucosamine synthase-like glycosyltransferase
MIWLFYFLAAILVLLSFKSFLGGLRYLAFFKKELAKPPSGFAPFATVIAPCRGMDQGLAENLNSLLHQDYPQYEVIFVVDNADDRSVDVIEKARAASSVGTKLVVAKRATDSSQKVENLREGVLHADNRSEIFVFVDSDVRTSKTWLRDLVTPLKDPGNGAATGYRWFISERPGFASEMRSVWNASIASALGPNPNSNFCWGGSTAIRRDTFERIGMRERWRGTLSDDFAVTRAMNDVGLPIVFVPGAMTVTREDCTFHEMLEFTTRQMKVTRVNAPGLWLMSLIGSGIFNVVLLAAFAIAVLSKKNDVAVLISLTTLGLVTIFSVGKAWIRLSAVKLALPEYETDLNRQFWTQNTLWIATPAIFFYNSLAALLSRRMTWRGTTYELKSPVETVIIER